MPLQYQVTIVKINLVSNYYMKLLYEIMYIWVLRIFQNRSNHITINEELKENQRYSLDSRNVYIEKGLYKHKTMRCFAINILCQRAITNHIDYLFRGNRNAYK